MEIHMIGPLAGSKHLERCRKLYSQMRKLNDGGWRLYNTTDNVRTPLIYNPKFQQVKKMFKQLKKLNDSRWRSFKATYNVPMPIYYNPKMNQRIKKKQILEGKRIMILWEVSFVNFDVKGPCKLYV